MLLISINVYYQPLGHALSQIRVPTLVKKSSSWWVNPYTIIMLSSSNRSWSYTEMKTADGIIGN